MTMISPTVKSWYVENPDWTDSKVLRATRNFGTSKDVDIYGFDILGWDEVGIDRAGYTAADYVDNPELSAMIARHAHRIRGPRNSYSSLRKIVPASDAVLNRLLESWPHATVLDGVMSTIPDRDSSTIFDPGATISRTIDATGTISVKLKIVPPSPDTGVMLPRSVTFTFSDYAAGDARDPINTVSFAVSVFETECNETTFTDLETLDDVTDETGKILANFDPDVRFYAISVEDDAEGCISALEISDETAQDDERAALAVTGDYLFMGTGRSREDALTRVRDGERLRTSVLMEMLERGLSLELEAGTTNPSFGG